MKSNGSSNLPNQKRSIKQPLISSLYDSSPQRQKVDVVKLINNQEQSRVSKVNIYGYQPIRKKPNSIVIPQRLISFKNHENDQEQAHKLETKNQQEKHYQNRTTQTFLNNYENNNFIGFGLYIVFMLLISAQVLVSTYFAAKCQNPKFCKNRGILLILTSELIYYFVVRIITSKTKLVLYRQSSVAHSIKNILSFDSNNNYQKDKRNSFTKFFVKKPYSSLTFLLSSILVSEIIYCWIATQSLMLFEKGSFYLVSTIYFSNFVLPFLVTNFYMNRHGEGKSWRMVMFPYLLAGSILQSLLQSKLFIILSLLKVLQSYLQSLQRIETIHINQITKVAVLIIWCIFTLFSIINNEEIFVKQNTLKQSGLFVFQAVIITFSFIGSRVIGGLYIKNQLHRYFYTQTHINLAFVISTIFMYFTYLSFQDQNLKNLIHCILAIGFLVSIFVVIYLEGKQKEQLNIQIILDEQQL